MQDVPYRYPDSTIKSEGLVSDVNRPFLQLSNNRSTSPPGDTAAVMTAAESRQFAQCVENINVLNLRLKNADERCLALRDELRRARQVRKAGARPSSKPLFALFT